MSKCYHCGRQGIHRHDRHHFKCRLCGCVFYRAPYSYPEYTPYYVCLDRWMNG